MKNYITIDPWCVIEEGFHPEFNEITESLLGLGNGRMGQRGNFEEFYSGHTLQGNYMAGVWFPDKTRVGWWKNGYPNYFAKVINACNWIGLDIHIEGIRLDLAQAEILDFKRALDMQRGILERWVTLKIGGEKVIKIESKRFCSLALDEVGAIQYSVEAVNFSGEIKIEAFLDGDVANRDSNHGEKFWDEVEKETGHASGFLTLQTKKSVWETVPTFQVTSGMEFRVLKNDELVDVNTLPIKKEKYVGSEIKLTIAAGEKVTIEKYAVNLSSENHPTHELPHRAKVLLKQVVEAGWEKLLADHTQAWADRWTNNDIVIAGDDSAQQGIRFNIFHLQQTYTGEDARLNIGPKGFTGEKYGGVTYWDTEAYCLPFYLATAEQKVARNLLVYRHNHLPKAIENGKLLGFTDGAALYPMVTMNGEECHNEWEITFEEIHRNGAIAYAIHDYIRYTGDTQYLGEYGLEVLLAISRFWAQRVNWSTDKGKYVMLGVTGPNEYENNVNNNWYTNYLAVWTLKYTLAAIEEVKAMGEVWEVILEKTKWNEAVEAEKWQHIIDQMYFPYDVEREVFLQQDGFLDKELLTVEQITTHRPINQKWSWDRILRSCFIKQADVLQGMYFFEEDFSLDELRRNFAFYEPMTVHESSLSPCVHVILAAQLGLEEKAYEMYVRTARLDLDDFNNDTEDGLHITSMAGTWMSVVKGFGGMRVRENRPIFAPVLPRQWAHYAFRVRFRGALLQLTVTHEEVSVENLSDCALEVQLYQEVIVLSALQKISVKRR